MFKGRIAVIKGLLFDLNGTVIDILTDEGNYDVYRIMSNLLSYQGVYLSPEEVKRIYFSYNKEQRKGSSELYPEFDAAKIFARIIDDYASDMTIALPKTIRQSLPRFLAETFRAATMFNLSLYDGVRQVLDELKLRYRLAAVSDGQMLWAEPEMRRVGLANYFEFLIVSGEYGYRKPDLRIYQKALTKMNLKHDEVIFIGNDMYRDVYGAHNAGMKTIFFKSNQGDQQSYGVEPDYIIYDFKQLPEAIAFLEGRQDSID